MQISIDYPFVPPQVTCQLPTSISTTANTTISNLLTQHEQLVNQYQELFDCLDDIDSNMRIIEPDKPTRTDLYRRIALGHHCSFQIEFNPNYAPKKDGKPKNIRFFGNLNRVQELKNKWKLYEWKLYEKMHVNLLNSFQIVTTTTEADEDYTNTNDIECGICYSFKLDNGELPEIICVNSLCNRGFHSICLYEVKFVFLYLIK
jgi:E3 ubiquitin-protein ligase FANCL